MDHGCLPPWEVANLPEPLPFSFRNALRTIGPGAILLVGSIGGGEWIVGPLMAVTYGPGILWIATVGVFLQMVLNLEAIRYTLYTGEPILTGIQRLHPGSRLWAPFYIAAGIAQLATPALALGCANVLFAAIAGHLADESGNDARLLLWLSYGILLLTVVLLLSGKSIERMLERISWVMVVLIFGFLVIANLLVVPLPDWGRTIAGFALPRPMPADMDMMLLALFASTAGSGGLGNLAISNLFRDKGFGMGAYMGGIGGMLAEGHAELAPVGKIFPVTTQNLASWGHWWKYALVDQSLLWAGGCLLGMFLNVNLAMALIPPGTELSGYAAGAFQAKYLAAQFGPAMWFFCLMNGFWILFSTQLGNTDSLTRTVSDICWSAWPRLQRLSSSRLYALLLAIFIVWGIVTLAIGEHALSLFKVLGIMASPIMAVAGLQILRVNNRFLPPEIRPPLWRKVALFLCSATYGMIATGLVISYFK